MWIDDRTPKRVAHPREIGTDEVRLAAPFLTEPRRRGSVQSYEAVLLLPPDYDHTPLLAAMQEALLERFGKPVVLPEENSPIKACTQQGFAGWYCISVSSDQQPQMIFDARVGPGIDRTRIYAGLWARVVLLAKAWDDPADGRPRVTFETGGMLLTRDDERLDGSWEG